jgi:hypothetical protein
MEKYSKKLVGQNATKPRLETRHRSVAVEVIRDIAERAQNGANDPHLRRRGGAVDLIWEADKYPSSGHVRYDFSAMPLAGGIVV